MAIKANTPYYGNMYISPFLIAGFIIATLVAIVLAGCSPTPEVNTPEVSATPWSAQFQVHLSEYLDPAWTSQPIVGLDRCWRHEDGELEGYINGKLIIVSADTGQLLYRPYSVPGSDDPNEPGTPDLVLPWANTPEEVGTVVLVWTIKKEAALYTDGSRGYRVDWGVKLVDFQTKEVVGDAYFIGLPLDQGVKVGEPPWTDLMAALQARLFALPFQAHLREYLDPAWTSPPIDWRNSPRGYINGKLIVVSADTGQLLRPSYSKTPYSDPNEPGPPEWGLPWADTPEEVGTVVLVWATQDQEFTYTDGNSAYREDFMIKVVDFQTKTVVGEGSFLGESLPTAKLCSGDLIGQSPWADMMRRLRALPIQTTPTHTLTPVRANASGDCTAAIRSRLAVGTKARVISNLNFRSSPDLINNLIRVNPIGTQLEVTGGPVCTPYENGTYLWWEVRSEKGETGWVVEGTLDGKSYFLEPLE